MVNTSLKRRRTEEQLRGKVPKKEKRKVKKQKHYHSSSEEEGGARDAPLRGSSLEPEEPFQPTGVNATLPGKKELSKQQLRKQAKFEAKKAAQQATAAEESSASDDDDNDDNDADTGAQQPKKPEPKFKASIPSKAPTKSALKKTAPVDHEAPLPSDVDDPDSSSHPSADDFSIADSESDTDASLSQTTKTSAPKPRKRNDPTAFATSIAKILNTKLPTAKRPEPILSRSKDAATANRALADAKLSEKARRQLVAEKKEARDKGRVRDVLGIHDLDTSTAAASARERELRRTAQKGVIKLFNAVRAAQVKGELAERESREGMVVGMGKREEKVKEMSKQGFLDMITVSKHTNYYRPSKSLACKFLVILGSLTTNPSNSLHILTWHPNRLVSVGPVRYLEGVRCVVFGYEGYVASGGAFVSFFGGWGWERRTLHRALGCRCGRAGRRGLKRSFGGVGAMVVVQVWGCVWLWCVVLVCECFSDKLPVPNCSIGVSGCGEVRRMRLLSSVPRSKLESKPVSPPSSARSGPGRGARKEKMGGSGHGEVSARRDSESLSTSASILPRPSPAEQNSPFPTTSTMASSRDAPNPLRPYYIPPSIGLPPDTPQNQSASSLPPAFHSSPSSSGKSSLGSQARDILSDIDYDSYFPENSPTIAGHAKKLLDHALWNYTSVLLAQPFEVAKTLLQVHEARGLVDGIGMGMGMGHKSRPESFASGKFEDYPPSDEESDEDSPGYFTSTAPRLNPTSPYSPAPSRSPYSPAASRSRSPRKRQRHIDSRSRSRTPTRPPPPTIRKLDLKRPDALLEVISQLWQKESAWGVWKATNCTFIYNFLLKTTEGWFRSLISALLNIPDPGLAGSGLGGLDILDSPSPLTSLGVAVAATAIAATLLAPLDMVRTRLIVTPISSSPRSIYPCLALLPSFSISPNLFPATLMHACIPTLISSSTPLFLRSTLSIDPILTPTTYSFSTFLSSMGELFVRLPLETVLRRGQVAALQDYENQRTPTPYSASSRPKSPDPAFHTIVEPGPYRGVLGTMWFIAREEGVTLQGPHPDKVASAKAQGFERPQRMRRGQGVHGLWRGWRVGVWGLVGVWGAAAMGGGGGEF
ncbi:Rrp15p-domain-containing protein [Decorospora gaudefroyi]|uniref:Rrp15p-domain-containing protein n=1 Tax=Decorospora gaudefroyi TaxID=184978 RepID=A0A6A5KJS0_9PLEO|nr:Rrp15p-domain-containing protein [Decorospora gaudefroyi]